VTVSSFSLREKVGMRGLKSKKPYYPLTLTLSLRERELAHFRLKHLANQDRS
jgi:hypothetical protein